MKRADLHIHSHHSDGSHSPSDVVIRARDAGLSTISLTDHDTISGIPEAARACQTHGLKLIAGVEVSARAMGSEVHLLIYGFNIEHGGLNELLGRQRENRRTRVELFLARFREVGIGMDVTPSSVLEAGESVGRPHLAELLVREGAARTIQDAFNTYLVEGVETFVPKVLPEGSEVISAALAASGICVLAHPGHYTSHQQVLSLIQAGLSGLEVIHPSHDESLTRYYSELAERFDLCKTGGSDYHGWREADEENLGRYFISTDEGGNIPGVRTLSGT